MTSDAANEGTWRRNLAAFAQVDAALARRLNGPDSIADGYLETAGERINFSFSNADVAVRTGMDPSVVEDCRQGNEIAVIEPDLDRIREALRTLDVSDLLRTGALHLYCPPLHTNPVAQISLHEIVCRMTVRLGDRRPNASIDAERGPQLGEFHDLVQKGLAVSQEVAERISRRNLGATPGPTISVVSPKCAIFNDLARCFERLGVSTRLIAVPDRPDAWSRTRWLHAFAPLREAPSLVTVARNRAMFECPRPGERLGLERFLPGRLVHWWWDRPNVASRLEIDHPLTEAEHFAFARAMLDDLPAGSQWLPPGARTEFVAAADQPKPAIRYPLSFVGQSRYAAMLQNLQMLLDGLAGFAGAQGQAIGRDVARISVFAELHEYFTRQARDIERLLAEVTRCCPAHGYFLEYLFQMCRSAVFRLQAVAVLDRFSIAVFGDNEWLDAGVVRRENFHGPAAPSQLPLLYRSTQLNMNLNFMQVSSTVNPKVLDVAAAGAAVLTDHRPELDELFPSSAERPASFQSLAELPDLVADLLRRPDPDRTEQVRQRVHSRHTLLHRAREICERLGLGPSDGPR